MSVLIACLLLGLVLVGCEVFVPGGILGVLGVGVMVVAIVLALAIFVVGPAFAANWIKDLVGGNALLFSV